MSSTSKPRTKSDVATAEAAAGAGENEYSPVMDVSPNYDSTDSSGISKEELEFQFVQNFHKTIRRSYPRNNIPRQQLQSQIFTMSFDHPQNFEIEIGRENGNGNSEGANTIASIGSAGSSSSGTPRPWFKIARVEDLWILTSMKGEPFLMIKESSPTFDITKNKNGLGGTAMDLYRYNPLALASESAQHEHQPEQPICRVRRRYYKKERKFRWRRSGSILCIGHYVELLEPFDLHYPLVNCHGYWPNVMHFTTTDGDDDGGDDGSEIETELATIHKRSFRNNKWKMTVSAERDVVLFLGIACALELLERKVNEHSVCC